jgi:hypothetical protein
MREILVHDEYVVSERVTLRAGDIFRAKGGPYYVKRDSKGNKVRMSMAARGPFRFMRVCEEGDRKWIEAVSMKDGTAAVISLTKRRSIMPGSLIPRPYVILGKVSGKRAARLEARRERRGGRGPGAGRRGNAGGASLAPPAEPSREAAGGRGRGRGAVAPGGPQGAAGGRRGAGGGGRGRRAVEAVLASLKPIDPAGR